MFAVRVDNQPKDALKFWLSPDLNGLSSEPERWDLSSARKFVDEHRTEKVPYAVYSIRGFYHKKVWPREEIPWT